MSRRFKLIIHAHTRPPADDIRTMISLSPSPLCSVCIHIHGRAGTKLCVCVGGGGQNVDMPSESQDLGRAQASCPLRWKVGEGEGACLPASPPYAWRTLLYKRCSYDYYLRYERSLSYIVSQVITTTISDKSAIVAIAYVEILDPCPHRTSLESPYNTSLSSSTGPPITP